MKKIFFCTVLLITLLPNLSFGDCPEDINSDGVVDINDFIALIGKYGQSCTPGSPCATDINGDGITNVNDFLLLLGKFAQSCPAHSVPSSPTTPASITAVSPFSGTLPALNTTLEVGTTAGDFNVTQRGGASYSIPLPVPPGSAGMVPTISISYNSQAGDGLLGIGWNLSGLSTITRAAQSVYYNGKTAPVALSNSDNFVLDGSYLIPVTGTNGQNMTTYSTELESFVRITSVGTSTNPNYFTVETKDGNVMEYGRTDDSYVSAGSSMTALTWLLDKVTDDRGNYMRFYYNQNHSTGEYYPDHIDYTGSNAAQPYNQVKFSYGTRSDKQMQYTAGSQTQQNVLLMSAQMYSFTNLVHSYTFNYSSDDLNSHLSEIIEKGTDGKSYNSTKFVWHQNLVQTEITTPITNMADTPFKGGSTNPSNKCNGLTPRAMLPGDYNGDGLMDMVQESPTTVPYTLSADWSLYLKQPSGTFQNSGSGTAPTGFITNMLSGPLVYYPDQDRYPLPRFGYTTEVPSLDINGDGKDDLVLFLTPSLSPSASHQFEVFLSTGTGFGQTYTFNGVSIGNFDNQYQIFKTATGDFDGDGISDLLVYYPISSQFYLFSVKNGVAKTLSFTDPNALLEAADQFDPYNPNTFSSQPTDIFGIDINGDGRSEVLLAGRTKVYVFNINSDNTITQLSKTNYPHWGTNTGSGGSNITSASPTPNLSSIYPGDFNGDGMSDVLIYNNFGGETNNWYIGYSNGKDGFVMQSAATTLTDNGVSYGYMYASNSTIPQTPAKPFHEYYVADFNGDGKSDIVDKSYEYAIGSNGGVLAKDVNFNSSSNGIGCYTVNKLDMDIYFSSGTAFAHKAVSIPVTNSIGSGNPTYVGDFNGDGHADLMYYGNSYEPDELYSFDVDNQGDGGTNKVVMIADGFNNLRTINYSTLPSLANNSSRYVKGTTATFPVNDIQAPISVASHVESPDGIGGVIKTDYSYSGAKFHLQGKGFLGFTGSTVMNTTSAIQTVNFFDEPVAGNFYNPTLHENKISAVLPGPGGSFSFQLIEDKAYTYTINPLTPATHYYTYLNKLIDTDALHGNTTTYTFQQDSHGNTYTQGASNAAQSSVTTNSFEQKGAWIPSRLTSTSTTVTRSGSPDYTRTTSFINNSFGEPVTITSDAGAITALTYDNFGNVKTTTVTGVTPSRGSSNTYDFFGRFAGIKTNALGQSSSFNYDNAYGNLLSSTDVNGLTTQNVYDGFGRLTQTTAPTSQTVAYKFHWDNTGPSNSLYSIVVTSPGAPQVTHYYDGQGRELRNQLNGFDGTPINTDKAYTNLGQVASISEPYFAPPSGFIQAPLYTTCSYDPYQRPYQIVAASGTNTTYSYSGNTSTTVTTSGSGTKTVAKTLDASGLPVTVTDDGGTLNYTYHSCGKVLTIGIPGTTIPVSLTYDNFGRKKILNDPDAGITNYTYDALDELATETNPSTIQHTYVYDALGRLQSNSCSEGVITYTYDSKPHGVGLPATVSTTGTLTGNQDYTYDSYGRMQAKDELMPDGNHYSTTYQYNNLNQVTGVTYPGGFGIINTYNTNGYLQTISKSDYTTIWRCTAKTARNQVLTATTGQTGGGTISKTYDSQGLGFLTNITATQNNVQVMNDDYNFDPTNGNLLSRKNNNYTGLTENFTYDNLDRLLLAKTGNSTNATPATTFYPSGNINTKSDVGTYTYLPTPPHAIHSIPNPTSNVSSITQSVTYTSNRVASVISQGVNETDYTYGPDYMRKQSQFKASGVLQQTIIYCGHYEKITIPSGLPNAGTYQVNYIPSPDGLVAMDVVQNGTEQMYYVHTDHLGSLNSIFDASGNKVFEQSFDAWGRQRNPSDWTYTAPALSQPCWLIRGYTGHEMLPQFGLINMNARLYDPLLGRVLSPDNYVQTPDFTQSYNRYSYCINNPLKYNDPTGNLGEDAEEDDGGVQHQDGTVTEEKDVNSQADLESKYGKESGNIYLGQATSVDADGNYHYGGGQMGIREYEGPVSEIVGHKDNGPTLETFLSINGAVDKSIIFTQGSISGAQRLGNYIGKTAYKVAKVGVLETIGKVTGIVGLVDHGKKALDGSVLDAIEFVGQLSVLIFFEEFELGYNLITAGVDLAVDAYKANQTE